MLWKAVCHSKQAADSMLYFKQLKSFLYVLLFGRKVATRLRPFAFFNPRYDPALSTYLGETFQNSGYVDRVGPEGDVESLLSGYMTNWLMNYWLRNSNRTHFGIPIEPRMPLLDYRFVEFSFSLPVEYLIHNGWAKYILRRATEPYLPKETVWCRVKRGTTFDTQAWFTSSKPIVFRQMKKIADMPYLDTDKVLYDYDKLQNTNPNFLWRCVNLCLWWEKVVLGRTLSLS